MRNNLEDLELERKSEDLKEILILAIQDECIEEIEITDLIDKRLDLLVSAILLQELKETKLLEDEEELDESLDYYPNMDDFSSEE